MRTDVRLNLYVKHNILPAMRRRGYVITLRQLNVVVVRTPFTKPDIFDDWIFTFGMRSGAPANVKAWRCTADPGTTALGAPWTARGTAILAEQQVINGWEVGTHKGYPALRQVKPAEVWRDNDKDNVPDRGRAKETGLFYTNIHASDKDPFQRPRAWSHERRVGGWSAGCVVLADSYEYACEFWPTILRASETQGEAFTVTILELPNPEWAI